MNWYNIPFSQLTAEQFHDLIALRISVFIVEQTCPYPELDGKDKYCSHVFGVDEEGKVQACARIVPPGVSYDEPSVGRVCSGADVRGKGAGRELMIKTMDYLKTMYGNVPVRISAQQYLVKFYESFGFKQVSESYLEDDIPHVEMLYNPR